MEILLAEEHTKVRYALRVLLQRKLGWRVIGEAGTAQELLRQVEHLQPHLLILDWSLPGLAEEGSVAALRANGRQDLIIIALSGRPEMREPSLAAGANAFVSKIDPPENLLAAIEAAFQTQTS